MCRYAPRHTAQALRGSRLGSLLKWLSDIVVKRCGSRESSTNRQATPSFKLYHYRNEYCPKVLLTYELLRNTIGAHLNERNPNHEKI